MPGYLRSDANDVFEENSFDSVNKLRTASPQALIDTDFEYGMQISKWENLGLSNNRPFSFPSSNVVPNITQINIPLNSRVITVTTSAPHGLTTGSSISVQDTYLSLANGNFIIDSVPTAVTFTYTARALNINTLPNSNNVFDPNKTAIYAGTVYTNARIGAGLVLSYDNRAITVTTTRAHGLSLGSEIVVSGITIDNPLTKTATGTSGASTITVSDNTSIAIGMLVTGVGIAPETFVTAINAAVIGLSRPLIGNLSTTTVTFTNAPNGSFFVARIISSTQFVYYALTTPIGTLVGAQAQLYVRPQAQFLHRPFDGGVIFSANATSNNQQAIRQTRRYFRYQSGKGIQISSGTVLKPNLSIESLTFNPGKITVQTKEQHNLQPGSTIKIFGAIPDIYNGEYTIVEILGYNLFQVSTNKSPLETKASGNYYATIDTWFGCSNRIGMFDEQNGAFFEFDGTTLYIVRRSSTYQLSGRISVAKGSNTVIETDVSFPTNFARQLNPGDFVVIRGQSYRIESIASNTEMTISPSYRGESSTFATFAKTVDFKIPQSEWNLDTIDGLGPSGYDVDLTKMQMFYIDYSWYGAGYIRWGLRGVDGNITYVHKMANNNVNAEAYMRSGNLPARYESNTFAKTTKLADNQSLTTISQTLPVVSTGGFAEKGTLLIRGGSVYEYVNYDGITPTSFNNLVREKAGAITNVTIALGSNIGTVLNTSGIQVGQRVIHPNFPDNTHVAEVVTINNQPTGEIKFSTAVLVANPSGVVFSPMSSGQAQAFSFSASQPVSVEQAYPTFSASVSHWGTSVIMDGGFDNDKSLVFTFGQTQRTTIPAAPASPVAKTAVSGTAGSKQMIVNNNTSLVVGMSVTGVGIAPETLVTRINVNAIDLSLPLTGNLSSTAVTFTGGNTKALFSIRVAPSVDNGISASFGKRELVNRMQLFLRSVGVLTSTANANLLVTAIINGVPTSSTNWESIVKNSTILSNSSLSQIADYSSAAETIILGGEATGGFYVQGTSSIDLENVRELGNSILGGGELTANTNVYPDGPDVLSIVVTNLSASAVDVLGLLSWTEAQA
jgi:hypothetical protein